MTAVLRCFMYGFADEPREAIRFHIEGLKEDGLAVPEPTSIADYVEA